MRAARVLILALLAAPLGAGEAARAQDQPFGGFFSHLFGGPPKPPPPTAEPAPRPAATVHKPRRRPPREAARPPAAPSTPPASATKFVYVLGDSLAISAADGMALDLQAHPEIGVIDRARDASGLVRDDYFDWPKAAREMTAPKPPSAHEPAHEKEAKDAAAKAKPAEKLKIDAVVVMLGINDKQMLRDGKDYVDPLSDRWKARYAERIQAVVAPFRAAHVPVIWVGLPPLRPDRFTPEFTDQLNRMFRDNAEKAGAKFVSVFDDFADQSGGFDAFGPNVEGQRVRLRGPDGIHMTAAGGAKLAHFIDVEVLAALGSGTAPTGEIATLPPDIGKAADDINEQIRREMGLAPAAPTLAPPAIAARPAPAPPVKPEAGAIASLGAHPASPGALLLTSANAPKSEAEEDLRRGRTPPALPGRADDFSK